MDVCRAMEVVVMAGDAAMLELRLISFFFLMFMRNCVMMFLF
jgi:hypothetical protein